jgi:ribonucleoside-diphosphate reductase alpha chain
MEKTIYTYEEALEASKQYFNGDELAADVFVSKYALKNNNGELVEKTPADMHRRLSKEFARIESKYPNPLSEEQIFKLLDGFKYVVPQGSPMSAIGNEYQIQSASNCFVLDSPFDSYAGILHTDQQQAQIMKRRGGVGFDISNIRPKGMTTQNAARTTDGIGVFMERFSNTCREVAQNGRRGALLLSISVHHPEIKTFINIKRDKKKVTGANISIRVTDEFMQAVKNNKDVQLR